MSGLRSRVLNRRVIAASLVLPALLLSASIAVGAGGPPVLFSAPMSPRNASYEIRVSLDPGEHVLKGTETIRFRNVTRDPVPDLAFHLYLNAFANDGTTFMRESGGRHRQFRFDETDWGNIVVSSLRQLEGGREIPLIQEFPGPDRTVMRARLPSPVPPGAAIEIRATFEAKLPRVFARTGWAKRFHMAGQWFPKLGVWEEGKGWNCQTFHYASEFFSDFGVYDVEIDVPDDEIVGATGVIWGERRERPGRKTVLCHAEDVHDFAWTASPGFLERRERWGGVEIRILMQPENAASLARYAEAARRALDFLSRELGPYPYSVLTIVDPPADGGGAGGMEYPTLVTGAASPWLPKRFHLPELAIAHEVAHQWWYGMSANDEGEEAWLDEGLASYAEMRILDGWLGPERSVLDGLLGFSVGEVALQRRAYLVAADSAPVLLKSWDYPDLATYDATAYSKPCLVLKTLENLESAGAVDRLLRTFFERARFRHPTTRDFLRVVGETLGPDDEALFRRLLEGTDTVNFKVLAVTNPGTDPFRGYDLSRTPPVLVSGPGGGSVRAEPPDGARVWIGCSGGLTLPAAIRMTFSDGSSRDETWDGSGSPRMFLYPGRRIERVEVDPDARLPLELFRLDNGWQEEADAGPAATLAERARWVLQALFSAVLAML